MLCRGFVFFNIFYMRDANKLFPKNYTKRVNCLIDAGKWHLIAHSSGFQQFHTPLWPYYIFTIRRTTIFFPLHIFMVGLQRDRELYCWMNIYIYIYLYILFRVLQPLYQKSHQNAITGWNEKGLILMIHSTAAFLDGYFHRTHPTQNAKWNR